MTTQREREIESPSKKVKKVKQPGYHDMVVDCREHHALTVIRQDGVIIIPNSQLREFIRILVKEQNSRGL